MTRSLGLRLLGIWLIVTGLIPFVHVGFAELGTILALLGVAAGVLILLGK